MAERLTEEQAVLLRCLEAACSVTDRKCEEALGSARMRLSLLERENAEQRADIERLKDELNQPVILSEWQQLLARVRELEGQQQGLIVERDQLLEEKRELEAELEVAESRKSGVIKGLVSERDTLRQQLAEAQEKLESTKGSLDRAIAAGSSALLRVEAAEQRDKRLRDALSEWNVHRYLTDKCGWSLEFDGPNTTRTVVVATLRTFARDVLALLADPQEGGSDGR